MAAGNTYWFIANEERLTDHQEGDLGATPNPIKCALITGYTPTGQEAHPTWGSSGSTDLSAYEVTPGGNYTAGGNSCANPGSTLNANVLEIDWDNPAKWSQQAGSPTNARYAVFYDTVTENCYCFYDLGTTVDLSASDLTLTMGTPALTKTAATP